MSPLVVYRFEHSEFGYGPMSGDGVLDGATSHAWAMPRADEDEISGFPETYRFGCGDLSRMVYWFDSNDRTLMQERGLVMRTYLVPPGKFRIGLEQVVFDREAAVKVEETTPCSKRVERVKPRLESWE